MKQSKAETVPDAELPARRSRVFASKFKSVCRVCWEPYPKGAPIAAFGDHLFAHEACTAPPEPPPEQAEPEVEVEVKPRRQKAAPAGEIEVNTAAPGGPWRN